MIRQEMRGVVYSAAVAIRREVKSCANLEDFSTFDQLRDCYSWHDVEDTKYLVIPSSIKEDVIRATMYIQVNDKRTGSAIRSIVRTLLEKEIFPKVCGVSVVDIGKPRLLLDPLAFSHSAEELPRFESEKILYMITHFK